MRRRRGFAERLHAWLLRLGPPRLNRRFRRRSTALLEELLDAEPEGRRAARARRALADAARTVVVAWRDAARDGTDGVRQGGVAMMRGVRKSVGPSVRGVTRRPLASALVVATLALALGANTAIFAVAQSVLAGALPYDSVDRIVDVFGTGARYTADGPSITEEVRTLPGLEAAAMYFPDGGANLEGLGDTRRVRLTQVSDAFFRVLGVDPLFGPGVTPGMDTRSVVVLSYDLWRTAFGSDPAIVGTSVRLSGIQHTVVGVVPPGVDFPVGTEAWVPTPENDVFFGGAMGPSVLARLAPDAERAVSEAILVERTAEERAEAEASGYTPPLPRLRPLRERLTGSLREPLLVLFAASGLIVLLGCVNLAGVAVAGLADRARELDVRAALGASRADLFSHLLTESVVLSAVGGVASAAVAAAALRLLRAWLPAEVPGVAEASLGAEALAFLVLATLAAGLAVGLLPALRGARVEAASATAAWASDDRGRVRLHRWLSIGQVALASVLVVGALGLGRSFARLHATPLGFTTDGVLTFQVRLPEAGYEEPSARLSYREQLTARLAALPGVRHVGATTRLPLADGMGVGLRIRPAGVEDAAVPGTWVNVSEGYMEAMGTAIVAGRSFTPGDAAGEGAVVLDRTMARTLFGEGPAVGELVEIWAGAWSDPRRVIGVSEPVHYWGALNPASRGAFYEDLARKPVSWLGFAVRASDPAALAPAVRRAALDIDPAVPPFQVRTTRAAVASNLAARRALAWLGAAFGAAAVLLATLGLYGVVAQSVGRRRRELQIRMALGAREGDLVRGTVARGVALAAFGLVLGTPLAWSLAALLESALVGVQARDATVLLVSVALLAAVSALASWLPARRITGVHPRMALDV